MANLRAIYSVGESLRTYLQNVYPQNLKDDFPCAFSLLSSGELNKLTDPPTTLSLYLYRVTMNEHLRNVGRVNRWPVEPTPLALDLHYLLTVWADNAAAEQTILAWAMRELFQHPLLDASTLSTDASWDPDDVVQVIPAELSNEEIMRVWDTLEPRYRLSISYVARVVRIDPDEVQVEPAVVAERFNLAELPTSGGSR